MPVISSGGSGAGAGSAMPISSGGAPVISAGGSPGISSGTGDVVLAPSAGGSRKRWPIVVGVLAVVAIVVVILVAVLVPRGSNNMATNISQLTAYLTDGTGFTMPEGIMYENTDDLTFAVGIGNYSKSIVADYYAELDTHLTAFRSLVGVRAESGATKEFLETVKAVKNAINYLAVRENLFAAYTEGGIEQAEEYYNNNIVCESERLDGLCDTEQKYYETELGIFAIYAEAECAGDKTNMMSCFTSVKTTEEVLEVMDLEMMAESYRSDMLSENAKIVMSDEIVRQAGLVRGELGNA